MQGGGQRRFPAPSIPATAMSLPVPFVPPVTARPASAEAGCPQPQPDDLMDTVEQLCPAFNDRAEPFVGQVVLVGAGQVVGDDVQEAELDASGTRSGPMCPISGSTNQPPACLASQVLSSSSTDGEVTWVPGRTSGWPRRGHRRSPAS